jgi:putative tryptophan/tyrosine transport system substrate-binding protein
MAAIRWTVALSLSLTASAAGAADVIILKSVNNAAWRPALDALRRSAPSHSFAEHDFQGDRGQGERIVEGLKGQRVILVALGPLAAQLAHQVAPDLPLVFCMVAEPEKLGLAPSRHVTGVALEIPVQNQLAAFRVVNPRAVRIGVLHGPDANDTVAEAKKAAAVVRLGVYARPLESDQDVSPALRHLFTGPEAVDALWLPADPLLLGDETRRFLLKEAAKAGKPVYAFSSSLVAEGALVSNSPDFASIGSMAAELVDRLAGGERDIGMLVPRAELVINTKAATRLKIDIPADVLASAIKSDGPR